MALTPEEALELLGRYNRWQIRTWLVFCFGCIIPASWMLMGFVFIGDVPLPYRCAVPEGVPLNESIPLVPGENGDEWKYASCEMYANFSVNEETVPCQNGYWYDPASGYTATLVSEFNLVCGRESLVELAMFINNMGAIFGNLFFSRLADMFGRKTIFLLCLWSNIPVAMSQAFAPSLLFYICMSFIDGAQQEGMGLTAATLSIEHFAIDQRTFASGGISLAWALGYMSLSGLAYVFRNWRHLLIVITLPLLASISYYWLIDESLSWLVANNKKQKADKILRKAARMCRVNLPDVLFDDSVASASAAGGDVHLIGPEPVTNDDSDLHSDELSNNDTKNELPVNVDGVSKDKHVVTISTSGDEKPVPDDDAKHSTPASMQLPQNHPQSQHEDESDLRQVFIKEGETLKRVIFKQPCFSCCARQEREEKYDYGFCDILKRKKLRLFAFCLWFIWFANGIGYYSLSFTVTYLPGDRYLNQFLYALVETPATIITIAVMYYIGRRKPLAFFHALAGVSLMCTVVQTFDCCRDMSVLIVALSIIGKFSFSATYIIIYMITPEIFPTNLRNIGLGMCQLSACLGSNLVPLMRILSRSYSWATPLIVGVVSLMAACLTLALPETRHTPLPESLADVDNLAQGQNKPSAKISQPTN